MLFFLLVLFISFLISFLFFWGGVSSKWEKESASSFECGFFSSFSSRFSFSMHFFMVGLIFLILDLELCLVLPAFNDAMSGVKAHIYFWMFVLILLGGLLAEWKKGELDWKF